MKQIDHMFSLSTLLKTIKIKLLNVQNFAVKPLAAAARGFHLSFEHCRKNNWKNWNGLDKKYGAWNSLEGIKQVKKMRRISTKKEGERLHVSKEREN